MVPSNIFIIGGGRWSRVLSEVLMGLTPISTKISIHSIHNIRPLNKWILSNKLNNRISVLIKRPEFDNSKQNLLIVANSNKDHYESVLFGLNNRVPVFAEKPLTLSYNKSIELKKIAEKNKTILVSSNIFLFANYFNKFLKIIPSRNNITKIDFFWHDAIMEKRYGEEKRFDSSIPVFKDVLHHILPLLSKILGGFPEKYKLIDVNRGGAKIVLNFTYNKTLCCICLERNSNERKRFIEIFSQGKTTSLDFSSDTPFILENNINIYTEKNINKNDRPIAMMFKSLFNKIYDNKIDHRLNIDLSISTSKLIDQINKSYLNIQIPWAIKILSEETSNYLKEDIEYFLEEIFDSKSISFDLALKKLKSYTIV